MTENSDGYLIPEHLDEVIRFWSEVSLTENDYWTGRKEKDFEKEVCDTLDLCGIMAIKIPDRTSEYTFPDVLCHTRLRSGRYLSFYIEFKNRNKKVKKGSRQGDTFDKLGKYCPIYVANKVIDIVNILKNVRDSK